MFPHLDIRRGLAVLAALILTLLWGGLAVYLRYDNAQTIDNANRQGENLSRAITKRLVEMHGGGLEFDSTPGRGTAVTIRMPAVRPAGRHASAVG